MRLQHGVALQGGLLAVSQASRIWFKKCAFLNPPSAEAKIRSAPASADALITRALLRLPPHTVRRYIMAFWASKSKSGSLSKSKAQPRQEGLSAAADSREPLPREGETPSSRFPREPFLTQPCESGADGQWRT